MPPARSPTRGHDSERMTEYRRNWTSYPHLGQPEGQTYRASMSWKRDHTYYITRFEPILPQVQAEAPDCFTPKEWAAWIAAVPMEGYRLPNSPGSVQNETPKERLARQRRAVRAAACDDCTLHYQLANVLAGTCHPPEHAITPADRLLEQDRSEGNRGSTAGSRTQQEDVRPEAGVPHGEDSQEGRAQRP